MNKRLENFQPGKTIRVKGVAPDSGRFSINLYSGDNPSNLVFHFNPRFDENCVVRNSRLGGSWGPEDRTGGMVFKPGKKFTVVINVKPRCFQVHVNDCHFCRYDHRHPISHTMLLEVDCGVDYF